MNQQSTPTIKQAIQFLKSGQVDSARSLLITILQENPNSEIAWYLLSFSTNESNRQIFALKRALSIKPDFTEAKNRLNKIIGMDRLISTPPITKEVPEETAKNVPIEAKEEKLKETAETPKPVQDEDLLSQRIFGQPSLSGKLEDRKSANQISMKDRLFDFLDGNPIVGQLSQFVKSNRKILLYVLFALIIIIVGFIIWLKISHTPVNISDSVSPTVNLENTMIEPVDEKHTLSPSNPSLEAEGSVNPILPSISSNHLTQTSTPEFNYIQTPEPLLKEQQIKLNPIQAYITAALNINTSPPDFPSSFIPKVDFESTVQSSLITSQLLDKVALDTVTYNLFGLSDPGYNLQDHYLNVWIEPQGGFYDPISSSIFVSGNEINDGTLPVYGFEYAQAIIDTQIKFENLGIFPYCQISNDRCQAMQALIKGAAAISQQDFDLAEIQDSPGYINSQSLPPYASADLAFPYVAGFSFFEYLINELDDSALKNALTYPPISTEQILHPEKYIYKEVPLTVHDLSLSVALGNNWAMINTDTLGEWKTFLYLAYPFNEDSRIAEETARYAAKGWGGDEFQVYQNVNTGQLVLFVHWLWDSPSESEEFGSAMMEKFTLQYDTSKFTYQNAQCWESADESDAVCLVYKNYQYYLIVAPDLNTSSKLATFISTQ